MYFICCIEKEGPMIRVAWQQFSKNINIPSLDVANQSLLMVMATSHGEASRTG
jgi:hypothetical protein